MAQLWISRGSVGINVFMRGIDHKLRDFIVVASVCCTFKSIFLFAILLQFQQCSDYLAIVYYKTLNLICLRNFQSSPAKVKTLRFLVKPQKQHAVSKQWSKKPNGKTWPDIKAFSVTPKLISFKATCMFDFATKMSFFSSKSKAHTGNQIGDIKLMNKQIRSRNS